MGCRVYLPREWAEDPERCVRVGVPPEVEFATKGGDCACAHRGGAGRRPPRPCVLADAAYGDEAGFRDRLTEWDLRYVVGARRHDRVVGRASGSPQV